METLKRGQIAVNKKALIQHCKEVHTALNYLDKIMCEPSSVERGRKVATVYNEITKSLHALEHFELNVPLNKLGTSLSIK